MDPLFALDTYEEMDLPDFSPVSASTYRDRVCQVLDSNLDFHGKSSSYASHSVHSFPAKFPPQLPRVFIEALTSPGDLVLDPMSGSGTTMVETWLAKRRGVAFDIDPLALRLSRAKTASAPSAEILSCGQNIIDEARDRCASCPDALWEETRLRFDESTSKFVDYWFARETQIELQSLSSSISAVEQIGVRTVLELILSSTIVAKASSVSYAIDLAHTRPHRAKIVYGTRGNLLVGHDIADSPTKRQALLTRRLRSAIGEFEKKLVATVAMLQCLPILEHSPHIAMANSQALPLADSSIDLIVTSPPYAANAIDYMRAHKFSLVWLGYPIDQLSQRRKDYVGGEATKGMRFAELPAYAETVVQSVSTVDSKRGAALRRYYTEMTLILDEMKRVLRPGKASIVVVGSSVMRGIDTQTHTCLAEIGAALGLDVPGIGVRHLDRDRRMMPTAARRSTSSGIDARMNVEYVIAYIKQPC